MSNEVILQEFFELSTRLSHPQGARKLISNISTWLSFNITIWLQYFKVNKNISKKYKRTLILNIGSGDEYPEKCINTDLFPTLGKMWRILTKKERIQCDCFLNVLYRDKYLENKADYIIFSHVMEHIPPYLAIKALKNLKCYLKEGGILRISVPDINSYNQNPIPNNQKFSTPILAKNSLIYGWHHKFMYDQKLLTVLLESVGFCNIRESKCCQDEMGEFDVKRRENETIYLIATSGVARSQSVT